MPHSPAPFKIVGPYQITVLDANDKIIGDFMIRVDYSPEETCAANAKLFAAAPELLAVLQRSLNWLSSYPGGGADGCYDQARAAIARATGETNE
jgi:hypothetical protein